MPAEAIAFERFDNLKDDDCEQRIAAAKSALGRRAVILAHHYQRADVYKHADLTGDSLKLSRLAAETDADYLVFCGVHFMAEVADILSKPEQIAILPDLSAGCSMADMASLAKVERAWRELDEVLEPDEMVTPVTYINSAADLKAFCGRARRHRLHIEQCRKDIAMVVFASGKGIVFPGSASGALERPQTGHSTG